MSLAYAPTAAANSTLYLTYGYNDDSGTPKTGTVSLTYRATTHDIIVATPAPSALAVAINSSTPVTVAFTTDDGNTASALSVTTDLATLPSGWTSASPSFACAAVSTGGGCVLNLTYAAPPAAASGSLSLTYGYNDDSGMPKTGMVSIPYAAM